MSYRYLQIYGFDLTVEGELGPGTIKRLYRGLYAHRKTGCVLVVSATASPRHKGILPVPMANLMYDWLILHEVDSDMVWRPIASTFDTEGECEAFCSLKVSFGRKAHCSSWWHVPRILLLTFRYRQKGEPLPVFVPVWDIPSVKMCVLEVAKIVAMFFPKSWQMNLKSFFEKLSGRTTSY